MSNQEPSNMESAATKTKDYVDKGENLLEHVRPVTADMLTSTGVAYVQQATFGGGDAVKQVPDQSPEEAPKRDTTHDAAIDTAQDSKIEDFLRDQHKSEPPKVDTGENKQPDQSGEPTAS